MRGQMRQVWPIVIPSGVETLTAWHEHQLLDACMTLFVLWVLGCMRQTDVRLWANRAAHMQKKAELGLAAIPPHTQKNCCVPVGLCQQQNRSRRAARVKIGDVTIAHTQRRKCKLNLISVIVR
jgi:hypothetical protein